MKKLPLVITMVSLLTATSVFAESTTTTGAQVFSQKFELSVTKETDIIVEPAQKENIPLSMVDIIDSTSEEKLIGSMNIDTTADHCFAKITTQNDFKFVGAEKGEILASYMLIYSAADITGDIHSAHFNSNNYGGQAVGCKTGKIKMRVNGYQFNNNAAADAYGDVINVEVRAES